MKTFCVLAAAVAVSAVSSIAAPARAELLASDSFVCEGTMEGRAGGVGFLGPWRTDSASASAFMVQPAISGLPITSVGGALHVAGRDARLFRRLDLAEGSPADKLGLVESAKNYFGADERALGKAGTTIWLGFIARGAASASGPGVEKIAQMHLYHGVDTSAFARGNDNKDGEAIAIGRGNMNTDWNYESTCKHTVCTKGGSQGGFLSKGVPFNDDRAHWVVMRFAFEQATTKITFWLDPAPGTEPAESAALALSNGGKSAQTWVTPGFHFDWIELGAGAKAVVDFDEVRLATSFTDLEKGASEVACGARIEVPADAPPKPSSSARSPDHASPDSKSPSASEHGILRRVYSIVRFRKRYFVVLGLLAIGAAIYWLRRRRAK
jgi:hypothetical protein